MRPKFILFYLLVFIFFLYHCSHKKHDAGKGGLSLLSYGIPCTIQAPADVQINQIGSGKLADVAIRNKSDYDIQVFMSAAYTTDLIKIKAQKKAEIASSPIFRKIIEEGDSGFIFENQLEDGSLAYDFKVVKVIGSNEVVFQCGNTRAYTEAEVKKMFRSIAP